MPVIKNNCTILHLYFRSIERLRKASKEKKMTREQLELQMSHPVRVLRFVTGIYVDVEDVRATIHMSSISEGTLAMCTI